MNSIAGRFFALFAGLTLLTGLALVFLARPPAAVTELTRARLERELAELELHLARTGSTEGFVTQVDIHPGPPAATNLVTASRAIEGVTYTAQAPPSPTPVVRERILAAIAGLVALLLFAAWKAAGYVTRPLKRLSEATTRIASGELGTRVPPLDEDEVGALARDFNRMAEQLERRHQELQRFLATFSHELRTPLTSILGYCDLLTDGLRGPLTGEQEETLQTISRNARALLRLIEDLLDLSRIEAGKLTLELEPVVLQECLEEACQAIAPRLAAKNLELHLHLPKEPLEVRGDYHRLRQVFLNLLDNAVKFTPAGNVTLSATERPLAGQALAERSSAELPLADQTLATETVVAIEDTGPGIPPERQLRIFDPFETEGGAGLGLAISKRLVELHGGTLEVESEPGRGSRFTVTLR